MVAGGGLETSSGGGGGGGGGGSSINFSTDEQAVGTWVDGSTVYMRTYHQTNADYYFNISELSDANNFVLDVVAIGKETSYNNWFAYGGGWLLGSSLAIKEAGTTTTYTSERYATVLYIKKGENS